MFFHYLTTTLHNLQRHRLATLTHILGLALGLACFVVSFAFTDGLRYSEPHLVTADRTFVLTQDLLIRNAGKLIPASPRVTLAAYKYLKTDFPQLESVARAMPSGFASGGRVTLSSGEQGGMVYSAFADAELIKVFHLKVIAGDPDDVFKGNSGSAITERAALRMFGTRDVIGRRFMLSSKTPGMISAVIADVPQPSHLGDGEGATLRFEMLSPVRPDFLQAAEADWTWPTTFIYLVLPANGSLSIEALRASLRRFGQEHMPAAEGKSNFDAVPVNRVRQILFDRYFADTGISGITGLYTLDALVLIVACFNYANLSTALALRRTREIALRKIVGAKRAQLVWQCFFEAALVGLIALVVAIVLTLLLIPLFNALIPGAVDTAAFAHARMWGFLTALAAGAVFLAGLYPAYVLSRLRPLLALRATSSRAGAGGYVPRVLIGLQFMAAGFLIIMVLVVQGQNRAMRSVLADITRDPEIVITNSISQTPVDMRTLRARLLDSPAVTAVTSSDSVPWADCCWVFIVSHSTDPAVKAVQAAGNRIGPDYFRTVGLKLLAGRSLQEGSEDETTFDRPQTVNVVIDRALSMQLGYATPGAAVGAILYRQPYLPRVTLRVVGVAEDAPPRLTNYVGSRGDLYMLAPKLTGYAIVRFRPEQVSAAVAHIEKTWKELAPGVPLERRFLDQLFEDAYTAFGGISKVTMSLAVCAVIIALMGLSGMAVQVTNGRRREIGVRKTLGAKSARIFALMVFDFAKPILIANLIAWPFAFFAARAYLSLFMTPMSLTVWVFLASLAVSVAVACLVVSGQSLRAARALPADVLRTE